VAALNSRQKASEKDMAQSSGSGVQPLREIYFYLTEACNLRCRHCWIAPKFQGSAESHGYLEPELFASIVEQALPLGLTGVKLSGGEPLLHPAILEIIQLAKARALRVTLETNGVLCTDQMASVLAGYDTALACISLDGVDAETHEWVRGVDGCFEAALEGLRNFVKAGLRPQIIFTLLRLNLDQVERIIDLAESLGAGSVKFNLLQPTERGALMHQSDQVLTVRELIDLGRRVERQYTDQKSIRIFFHQPPAFRPLSRLFGGEGGGCGVCGVKTILGVLHDGSYALCGIGESIPALVFGNAEKDVLADIWCEHPVLQEIRAGLPASLRGVCADCLMKGICLGACAAQNYYRHGNLWGPYWFCEQAHKDGAFPATRLRPDSCRRS
jgi:SynChlorMet cassette radical SAM/SPASM protein ScmF